MGTRGGLEEALFPALISTDFLQNPPKFLFRKYSEESRRPLNGPSSEFQKSTPLSPTSRQPQRPQNISKKFSIIFSIISGAPTWRIYKVHRQALPGPQNHKRVHGEFCGESREGSCDGFRGASSVNLAAPPFSKTRLNLQATHKNLPRKATTDQNARRCKYSFLGIQ
mgnify:CR=1 FL=1